MHNNQKIQTIKSSYLVRPLFVFWVAFILEFFQGNWQVVLSVSCLFMWSQTGEMGRLHFSTLNLSRASLLPADTLAPSVLRSSSAN